MKSIIFTILMLPAVITGQVKTVGTPNIHNYSRSAYQAGTQNWGIAQDKNGFMYFANNDGVLKFDGTQWELIRVSNSSPVRSVYIDEENNMYIGLFNDFGLLKTNASGNYYYSSLRDLLPPGVKDFDDIWRIFGKDGKLFFQTFEFLFIYENGQIQTIKPQKRFHFSFLVNGELLIHEPGVGIFIWKNGKMEEVPWSEKLRDQDISVIIENTGSKLLIGTSNGLYSFSQGILKPWDTQVNKMIEKNKLFCAVKTTGNHLAFGTVLDGVFISDQSGNLIQHISRKQGLQNNTVLSAFSDKNQNLWLGLDNGIDFIETNSPISFITDVEGLGTGYSSILFEGMLYLGTNQGLFVKPFGKVPDYSEPFVLVNNMAGQVWSLEVFNGQLICGHNLGAFRIKGKESFPLYTGEGLWKCIPLLDYPDLLLGGCYTGLVLFKKGNQGWEFYREIDGYNESSRFLDQASDRSVWVSHGAKGIFRIILGENPETVEEFTHFSVEHGLPSNENNILFHYAENQYISTTDGIFSFNDNAGVFERNTDLMKLLNIQGRIKTFKTDAKGNIWYISENESGVLRLNEDRSFTKIVSPFKLLDGKYVNEFEFIYPHSDEHVFFGLDNGFAHYSSLFPRSYTQPYPSYITKIELPYLDSVIRFPGIYSDREFEFPFKKNAFRFHFSTPFYENPEQNVFSYLLENFSEDWSPWSADQYKDYTNLPEDDYTFKLKARNVFGVESDTTMFKFSVLPPWYRSKTAYYFYFIFGLLFLLLGVKYVRFRIERSGKRAEEQHRLELQKKEEQFQHQAVIAEKEIIRLRNEKLRDEMIHRDKELANQTMSIIQKNKLLMKLKDELQSVIKNNDDPALKTRLVILNRRLDREIDNKQQNKIFETYFDEVHNDFFKQIKQQYPQLSSRELRLCAFIRMNLSTKEIAALLNISDRGVEISRYRLRKKLNLPRDVNLSSFLTNF